MNKFVSFNYYHLDIDSNQVIKYYHFYGLLSLLFNLLLHLLYGCILMVGVDLALVFECLF